MWEVVVRWAFGWGERAVERGPGGLLLISPWISPVPGVVYHPRLAAPQPTVRRSAVSPPTVLRSTAPRFGACGSTTPQSSVGGFSVRRFSAHRSIARSRAHRFSARRSGARRSGARRSTPWFSVRCSTPRPRARGSSACRFRARRLRAWSGAGSRGFSAPSFAAGGAAVRSVQVPVGWDAVGAGGEEFGCLGGGQAVGGG